MGDLYDLSSQMLAEESAMFALIKTLRVPLVVPVPPRAVLLGLTVCQPILLRELLTYLSAENPSRSTGYGIIGAYALVYTGSALSSGFYWYKQYQFLTMVRACLVSAISWKTAQLDIISVDDPKAAVTLISTDVERIMDGLAPLHDFWANIIQVGIALYLLEEQMGIAFVVPIAIIIICTASTSLISHFANKRQIKWMESVQHRVGITSAMLLSLKAAKMRGIVGTLTGTIHQARLHELKRANQWRSLTLVMVGLSFVPEYLSASMTFVVYILQARANGESFDASRAFTTLSLLIIMTQPLNGLIQSIPGLVGAAGCLGRIGQFLSNGEQLDFRDLYTTDAAGMQSDWTSQAPSNISEVIELRTHSVQHKSARLHDEGVVFRISDGSFGWGKGKNVLKDINLSIPLGRMTCIVGPVASGKSTLCHTFLGETTAIKGQVEFSSLTKEIAFCHQSAYLVNGTIRENIVGYSEPDNTWYDTVVQACGLQEDVSRMSNQHSTVVGSAGINLSGGQRHKVALARAIYARKAVLVLDDIFSGFDTGSEQHVFDEILGPLGLARKHNMTVIFVPHAVKHLPHADYVVALGSSGKIEQQGSFNVLRAQPGYIQALAIGSHDRKQDGVDPEKPCAQENAKENDPVAEADLSRQIDDSAIYRYYLSVAGIVPAVLMLLFAITSASFVSVSTFWLKLWTGASPRLQQSDHYKYVGVYALFQVLAILFLILLVYQLLIILATKTGLEFHSRLLQTVKNASLLFFSMTDNGSITNRFSQDIQLIDSQLPNGLVNLTFAVFVATGQSALIIASSPWVGLTVPVILILFYTIQKYYLRTSRQLRLLDLEAKGPLYTNFVETLNGLATIRAFGWTSSNISSSERLLNRSQKPMYLLSMIQRWLTFVLDMIVAIVAVMVAALAVLRRGDSSFAGVALTQVLQINLTLRGIIIAWTEVETCIGSVNRVKTFSETTPSEHKLLETNVPAIDWPHNGRVELKSLSAAYESAPDRPALRNLDLVIDAGEKFGVCGRSGSGKSSFILALLRTIEVNSGAIRIDDLDLALIRRDVIRQRLNVVPQDALYLPISVRNNLDPLGEASDSELIEALEKVQLWSKFEGGGGLDIVMSDDLLSQGQRQLFCLASAILRRSKIVILDEVTSRQVEHLPH
ncbi:hypothetical protein LTR70_004619 [Exophiala xenobiotica]|uniref:Uncharacterized protein n=1 Tax=Lithohypha guttulata TaxID=1690604 RepID=A0ABR0KCV2_9EURO|nr:hypothetical protein LTR24_004124 [Lithohypha guttulata]KAK5320392.1 hypothetical protein LTR70_004619 [Exophiala xenobiotica]